MLYNKEKKRVMHSADCITCPHFDNYEKKCNGIGVCCFEYDPMTKTAVDPVTKLVIKLD